MKEWTLEERYRVLQGPEDIADLHARIKQSEYRQRYHIQPVTGLSSDPNGFSFDKGKWQLFYQWCPWGAVHGLKYWYHVVSEDLVHWKNLGVGLRPDRDYDNKGAHSGSAIVEGDDLYVFYTGNHRDENWIRTPYTCAAKMDAAGNLEKLPQPLFGPREDYSEHQRDPKVLYHPERQRYYIFLGAQTMDKKGTALIYESEELLSGWHFAGQLKVQGYEDFGGMWECPSITRISGKDLLIFSPQYTKLPGRGEGTNHNVYFIGQMDYDTLVFVPEGEYHYLDYGFDFYAAQTAANVGDADKAVLMAWMGLPDNHYPTEPQEWEGSLTLPRELRILDGKLVQRPVEGLEKLRREERQYEDTGTECLQGDLPDSAELELVFGEAGMAGAGMGEDGSKTADVNLFTRADGSGGLRIHYDAGKRCCVFDKRGLELRFNEKVGEVLEMPLEAGLQKMRVFVDRSSVEFFVNDGEKTFSAHVYPTAQEHHYQIEGVEKMRIWELGSAVVDDFVV